MSLLFSILKQMAPISRKELDKTHTQPWSVARLLDLSGISPRLHPSEKVR